MAGEWRASTWGQEISLEYGKALRDYDAERGKFRVFGSNGPIGWTDKPLALGPGVILGRKGAYRGIEFSPEPFFVIDTAYYVVPKGEFDMRWLYYAIKHHKLGEIDDGSPIPSTTRSAVYVRDFDVPPLSEQNAIAAVLGALDDKIELNRRMNATLEAMARALFQSWFVDFDPVRAKLDGRQPVALDSDTAALFPEHLEASPLGDIPKGWPVQRISEVVEEVFDGPHATPPNSEEGPVFLGIKNLTGSALDLSDIRHISESDWPRWTKRVTPRPLDIVFSYEATLGFFALIPPGLRCCLGRRLALVRPRTKDGHSHFCFHQFIGPDFQRYLMQHSVQGATVDRIPLVQFPKYLVLNPPPALKEAFESRVAPLWAKIHSNAQQSRTLATLRDTLLPKLLSGELRGELLVTDV